jgi:hypothetical protein
VKIEILPSPRFGKPDFWDLIDATDPDNRICIATVYTTEADALIVKRALEGGDHAGSNASDTER